ncbi:MAG: hypothetical protein HXY41_09680 [Chloroflexi bacterium]|nr:hypothetical protein [Chloroflexota bacterium]
MALVDAGGLKSNQEGTITGEQRAALLRHYDFTVYIFLLAFLAAVLFGPGALVLTRQIGMSTDVQVAAAGISCVGAALAVVGLGVIYQRIKAAPVQQRLDAGVEVEPVDGEITFRGGQYVILGYGRGRLKPLYKLAGIKPGRYCLYVLKGTRWALSAQSTGTPADSDEYLWQALVRGNRFDGAALSLNQAGWLSLRQRVGLLVVGPGKILAVAWGAVFIGFILLIVPQNGSLLENPQIVLLALVGFGALILLLTFRRLLDAIIGRVLSREGIVKRSVMVADETGYREVSNRETPKDAKTCLYRIDHLKFKVKPGGYNALLNGRRYIVYYTAFSHRLVNIEPARLKAA